MSMRSWVLKSWPEVIWQPPASASLWPAFHHMGTDMRAERDEWGRAVGETVWAARLPDGSLIGAAWEWVEILSGAPALRDPNGFISNARLIGDGGSEADELETIVGLNRIAHAAAWHATVQRVLEGAGTLPQAFGPEALAWPRAVGRLEAASGKAPARLPRAGGRKAQAVPVLAA